MELGKETCKSGRVSGPATILAIATANPPNCFYQSKYPDYYFRVTKSDHMVDLKNKFKHPCEKSMIRKRYMHVTEEILEANPSIGAQMMPSLDARLDMEIEEVAKLGAEAATKAIAEWGRPKSAITHLIFHSTLGMVMPGADYQVAKLLGLEPSVKRLMLYHLGCYGGGTVLRLAKDLAENNDGARVLVVCSEVIVNAFRGPSHAHMDILVGHALFGDGAAAAIVGANPADDHAFERPLFQIVSADQRILPDSEGGVGGRLREVGLIYYMSKEVSSVVESNIENCLVEAFSRRRSSPPPVGVNHDWNSLFWIVHPGGRKILDAIEARLELKEEKLRASREVMREYGNMMSSSVMFVLDEMRKRSAAEGRSTTGNGLEWGVFLGFGPGVTVETIVLRSVPTP